MRIYPIWFYIGDIPAKDMNDLRICVEASSEKEAERRALMKFLYDFHVVNHNMIQSLNPDPKWPFIAATIIPMLVVIPIILFVFGVIPEVILKKTLITEGLLALMVMGTIPCYAFIQELRGKED